MIRKIRFVILILAFTLASLAGVPAFANYTCSGPVNGVTLSKSGTVMMDSASGLREVYLCSLTSQQNGVDVDTCKAIYAQLLSAQVSGQSVIFWFDDGLDCSSHSSWDWLTGWYWGPEIQHQ